MLEFRQVSKQYHQEKVLDQVSFTAKEGEVVVLIGPSGCGKTTSLKMINRLIDPTSGQILLGGKDIRQEDPIRLRRRMGYVIQQTGLFPHMTVEENIQIIPRLEKRPEKEIAQRTVELMKMVGLSPEEFLFRYPNQLSGGQQQRIGVARAFATDPEIVLMDEPFSALDPITRSQLQDELVTLQAQLHKTIVFVTHDMDEAIKIADKICIMHKGHVLQYDTPENILKYPAEDFVREFVGRKRIWSSPELIRARDIMMTAPITAPAEMAFLRAVEVMRMNKVDSLLVVDSRHRFLGIVSVKELRRRAAQEGFHPEENAPLRQLMNPNPPCCRPEDSIVSLLKTVNDADLATLPVVDEEGILRGLITKGSLVSTLSQQFITDEGGVSA